MGRVTPAGTAWIQLGFLSESIGMKPNAVFVASIVFWVSGVAGAQGFTIEDAAADPFVSLEVPILMASSSPSQGFVLAIGHTPNVEVLDFAPSDLPLDLGAELFVGEIFPGAMGCTLGVVLDAHPPFESQLLPPGTDLNIATLTILPTTPSSTATLSFVDGGFGDPALSNAVVIGGLSIGAGQGLALDGGDVVIGPAPGAELELESVSLASGGTGVVRVRMTNPVAVEGFVLAISHPMGLLSLTEISLGEVVEQAGPEFVVSDAAPPVGAGGTSVAAGGTLSVVLDFDAPYLGQAIPPGVAQPVAKFSYERVGHVFSRQDAIIAFVDGVFGMPPLDNVVLVGGQAESPALTSGVVHCEPVVLAEYSFHCGAALGVGPITSPAGRVIEVPLLYASRDQELNGLRMSLSFDSRLECGDFVASDAPMPEFVTTSIDNDPFDGDGSEALLSVVIDAFPPFSGATLPATSSPQTIGMFEVWVPSDAALCGLDLAFGFVDGLDGAGGVPFDNAVYTATGSVGVAERFSNRIRVLDEPTFVRGDCNEDGFVDIADGVEVARVVFQGAAVACRDACDANDDGGVDVSDVLFVLTVALGSGASFPPPGLEPGIDPTPDSLDCAAGPCGG